MQSLCHFTSRVEATGRRNPLIDWRGSATEPTRNPSVPRWPGMALASWAGSLQPERGGEQICQSKRARPIYVDGRVRREVLGDDLAARAARHATSHAKRRTRIGTAHGKRSEGSLRAGRHGREYGDSLGAD
jgi:hypothetical protein